jgi:hypothetical protein
MKEFEIVGMKTMGNMELLQKPRARIGVYASRQLDGAEGIIREQWAIAKGRQRKCIAGTFHSQSECEILYYVLKYGGSAVWFMGCKLPDTLPDFCKKAVKSGRLLMVSCFNRERHNLATARYCMHMVDLASSYLVFWALEGSRMLGPIRARAVARGKWVECF